MNPADAALTLPPAALPAWQAYRAMLDTKAAHFTALAAQEQAANAGQKPRLAQQAHLAALLDAHSAAVGAFKMALQALSRSDPAARDALIAALARVNEDLAPDAGGVTH